MGVVWKSRLNVDFDLSGTLPPLIEKILISRNIKQQDYKQILYPKLSELKDPYSIKNMDLAVNRLVTAYENDETICIYADFDLDGSSGLALLYTGLKGLGFKNILNYQPKRLSEGYGFHAHFIDELKEKNVSLIVTVDVGITSHEACLKAKKSEIDVIITDHHLPSEFLPEAFCVVNPNQATDTSGLGYLSGAGVAFYLLRALKRQFVENPKLENTQFDLKEVLEFFTIATLTDMVPLIEDNRVLVKHGLAKLSQTNKSGLRALLKSLSLTNRELSSQDVAIRFAPKLNALSRMEADILPIDIMLEDSQQKAEKLIDQVLAENNNRIQFQNEAEIEAMEKVKSWELAEFVYVASENFHRGIVGLIATKLSQNLNRPAFVGSIGADGKIVGSARLPQGHESSLVEAMNASQSVLNRFGGHSAAAGFELEAQNQQKFIRSLAQYYETSKSQIKTFEYTYDTIAELSDLEPNTMKWYDFIGPFGVGFESPILRFSNLIIHSVRELKGGHLKISFLREDKKVEALLFSPTNKQRENIKKFHNDFVQPIDVLAEMQWNYFNGSKTIQLLIKDLKCITADTQEILI